MADLKSAVTGPVKNVSQALQAAFGKKFISVLLVFNYSKHRGGGYVAAMHDWLISSVCHDLNHTSVSMIS